MNLRDIPELTIRIRGLQEMFHAEHAALVEWGAWSWDISGLSPRLSRPSLWDQFARSKVEDWGEEQEPSVRLSVVAKSEPPPKQPYNERMAVALDERLHGPGGPAAHIRQVAKVAYVSREIPEEQFAKLAGCTEDAFCERLEALLRFVRRWV